MLLVGATAWLVAGMAAAGVGVFGAAWLHAQLPPIYIDAAALGGGLTAVGVLLATIGVAQAAVLVALGSGRRPAQSVAILLTATLAATLLVGAVAAATGAATVPALAAPLLAVAVVAALAAAAYALAAAHLMGGLGAGGAF